MAGTIEKSPDGSYKTRLLSHEEILRLELSGNDISDKDFEIFSEDADFRSFVSEMYSEFQQAGILPICERCSADYSCCSSDEIGEPRITPFEAEKISRRFGLHPECITKYIVPEKGSGLWFGGYHGPAMVLKRNNDPCVFMYFKDNSCIRYNGACLMAAAEDRQI